MAGVGAIDNGVIVIGLDGGVGGEDGSGGHWTVGLTTDSVVDLMIRTDDSVLITVSSFSVSTTGRGGPSMTGTYSWI